MASSEPARKVTVGADGEAVLVSYFNRPDSERLYLTVVNAGETYGNVAALTPQQARTVAHDLIAYARVADGNGK